MAELERRPLLLLKRWLPVVIIAGLMALAFAMGWHKYLTFKTIGLNYEALKAYIDDHLVIALAIYVVVYIAVVALSLPGGLVMTLAGGLLFGWLLGTVSTVIAATIGATLIFIVAKSSFGDALARRAGPWLSRLRAGFQEDALSYLLFLRLVPAFPFFVVNLAPALLGVQLSTFVFGTFFGIIPGTAAFSVAGSGLGSVIEAQNASYNSCLQKLGATTESGINEACPYTIDTSSLVTRELLVAFVLLGVVALLPVVLKKLKGNVS